MSQEQQNTRAAVTQQQDSSTGPNGMGAREGLPPQSAQLGQGGTDVPDWGREGALQIRLGGH